MSLFLELEGLRGENLSSAILAHILLRSPDARARIINLFSDLSPSGPIYIRRQFAAYCEAPARTDSSDQDKGSIRGRLDILVETDDALIGIENKFHAPFQDHQPQGYLETLKTKSELVDKLRGTACKQLLIVLAPKSRQSEVQKRLRKQTLENNAAFLPWESVLDSLGTLSGASTVDRFLIRQLDDYVKSQLGNIGELPRLLPHLRKRWDNRGTAAQQTFLNGFIWSLLDESINETGAYSSGVGKSYYGWYLNPGSDLGSSSIWLGFHSCDSENRKAALLITTNQPGLIEESADGNPYLRRIDELQSWTNYGWECHEVLFSEDDMAWHNPERWREAVEPLNSALQELASRHGEPGKGYS